MCEFLGQCRCRARCLCMPKMRCAAAHHFVKTSPNDDLALGKHRKNVGLSTWLLVIDWRCPETKATPRQTHASFQVAFSTSSGGWCRWSLWLGHPAPVYFALCCILMHICCFLMHICVLLVCCSYFFPIQMHPRFHHFSSERKAPAHHEFRAETPTKATKVWFVCYFNKAMRHSSFFPRHTSQRAPPNWPHFCIQSEHRSCHENSPFAHFHSVAY